MWYYILNMPDFTHFIEKYGYIGMLIWFLTFDQITPIPEEISLLLIGYFCANHIFNLFLAGATCLVGFVAVDTLYFHLSKKGSAFLTKKSKNSGSTFIKNWREKLKEHMPRTLVILCFIPRMRMWGPILAGSMRSPFRKFLLYDSIGLCLFTIVYLSLGFVFHASLSTIMAKMKGWQHVIFIVAIIVIAVIIMIFIRKRFRQKNETA